MKRLRDRMHEDLTLRGMSAATIGLSNHTTFLRPISEGSIHAAAVPLHRGRTTWLCDVRFADDDGRQPEPLRQPQHLGGAGRQMSRGQQNVFGFGRSRARQEAAA